MSILHREARFEIPPAPIATKSFRPANYRPEIDGLRALAVLSVVGFHAFPTLMPGGFIGVDIFFVISGYLISGIIFKGLDTGKFDYLTFYRHRIRRIFPALSVVLAATLAFGAWALFPGAAAELGLQTLAATLFSSNLLLWTQSGYFDASASSKPLLHMWSLGIEEQFYLVWPLLLGLCGASRLSRAWMLAALGAGSFAWCMVLLVNDPVSAFYLPFSRFWELLVGAGLALASTRRAKPAVYSTGWAAEALSIVGMGLVIVSLLTLRANQPFPGWRALLPTLGALALIASGQNAWIGRTLLANRIAVFFGAISYPLYLWHWPLLTFPNILNESVPRNQRIAAVVASICLAWLTYRFVEFPVRSGTSKRITTGVLVVAMAVIGLAGFALYSSHGLPQRYPSVLRDVALADQRFDYSVYRERTCFLAPEQKPELSPSCLDVASPGKDKIMLLWGDSHAASLYPGMRALLDAAGSSYRLAQYNASACPPVADFTVAARPNCRAMNDQVMQLIERLKPESVVMLASWSFYNGGEFEKLDMADIVRTVNRIHAMGVHRIVVLGPLPRWKEHQPDVVLREWNRTGTVVARSTLRLDQSIFAADSWMREGLTGTVAQFISPSTALCTTDGCRLLVNDGSAVYPMAWDDAHLSVQGSAEVARLLAGPMGVPGR